METVFGPSAGRYHLKRTWTRDRWHFDDRVGRKVLSHTVLVPLAVRHLRRPLALGELGMAA